MALLPMAAHAAIETIANQGVWRAYGGTAEDGKQVCGMSARGSDRSFHLKYFAGDAGVTVQVFKDTWRIPRGTRAMVHIGVDGATRWNATALGNERMIEWSITDAILRDFEGAFRVGNQMVISFPNGSEEPWTVNLRGSNAITTVFVRCMRYINGERSGGPTQPFGQGGAPATPSAPTSPTKSPTQPY